MTIASVARKWQENGFSTIPVLPNATKRSAVRWAEYQTRVPGLDELQEWFGNGVQCGLALVMGSVSGGAEMLELEAAANTSENLKLIGMACHETGVGDLWELISGANSYTELSPSGGLHLIYRINGYTVPGNEKVASDEERHVLAETRGEGGYVIVAPSPGLCHPSGRPWRMLTGSPGEVFSLEWEERCAIHGAIRSVLDRSPRPLPVPIPVQRHVATAPDAESGRPGDEFEARTDWADPLLLGGAGWQVVDSGPGGSRTWVRPGKAARDGISATTGRDADRDRLYVFSTSTVFPTEVPLTKFGAYAILHHGGDHKNAAGELRRLGYGGSGAPMNSLPDFPINGTIDAEPSVSYTLDDLGGVQRLADYVDGRYIWVTEEDTYYRWNGVSWAADKTFALTREYVQMTAGLLTDPDDTIRKWASKSRGSRTTQNIVKMMRTVEGISRQRRELDRGRGILNLRNGILNLRNGSFGAHRMELLQTRVFNARYDADARCPRFETFMEAVLPDPQIRSYVQRAVGYSLLGEADQRALFLVWGPSGTGKSQFLETLQHVFGDYAAAASPGTFMSRREGAPSSDLHRLRGKRLVSTSETADSARFDEEVVKRITGDDTMTTRSLYQCEQEWESECAIWIATNNKPRFTSDDDAIWNRSKLLPFLTRFGHEGAPEVVNGYARRYLFQEANGILNWMLAGLHAYLEVGLAEPEEVLKEAATHRQEVDPVAMFLEEQFADGKLVENPLGRVRVLDMYLIYADWCKLSGERPLLRRRFLNRIMGNLPHVTWGKINGQTYLVGLERNVRLNVGSVGLGISLSANN